MVWKIDIFSWMVNNNVFNNNSCILSFSVGKTSLITRFMYDSFDNTYQVYTWLNYLTYGILPPGHGTCEHLQSGDVLCIGLSGYGQRLCGLYYLPSGWVCHLDLSHFNLLLWKHFFKLNQLGPCVICPLLNVVKY